MPVRIASKADYTGTVAPPSLDTETTVVEIGAQADDYLVEGYVDLGAMASGDSVVVREYIAVDGINYRKFAEVTYSGPVPEPVIRFHTKTLYKNFKYKVTITQTAGTLRSFPYAFILQVLEVV